MNKKKRPMEDHHWMKQAWKTERFYNMRLEQNCSSTKQKYRNLLNLSGMQKDKGGKSWIFRHSQRSSCGAQS
jgi:hypothetical protein